MYLFGTVNVDESTVSISDKVLDRANVLDTSHISLEGPLQAWIAACRHLSNDAKQEVESTLRQVWNALRDRNAHFGFRVAKAIVDYTDRASSYQIEELDARVALDSQLAQRILPKLKGDDSWLATLDSLVVCLERYPASLAIVTRMKEDLGRLGTFHYWG